MIEVSLDERALAWKSLLEEDYRTRMIPWSDIRPQMPLLRAAAERYCRPVIAELGTRKGNSTSALLTGAAKTGGTVWSVDIAGEATPPWWFLTGLWDFLKADDMSDEAARWLPPELDILFIDTSHLYDHTLAELRRYVPRVRPGGLVLCHDVELPRETGVMRGEFENEPGAWSLAAAGGPPYPVAAALDHYCSETGLKWERQSPPPVRISDEPFYGLGTITIPVLR